MILIVLHGGVLAPEWATMDNAQRGMNSLACRNRHFLGFFSEF